MFCLFIAHKLTVIGRSSKCLSAATYFIFLEYKNVSMWLVSNNPRLSGRPGPCNPAGSPGSATGSFCGLMRGAHVILDLLDSLSCPVLSSALWLASSPSIGKGWALLLKTPYPGWEWTLLRFLFLAHSPSPSAFRPNSWTISLLHIIIPNCIGVHISKLNLIFCFYAIFLVSLFHGALYFLLL